MGCFDCGLGFCKTSSVYDKFGLINHKRVLNYKNES